MKWINGVWIYESVKETIDKVRGATIEDAWIDASYNYDDGGLFVKLTDGRTLTIWDNGRSCCEHRYMVSDSQFDTFKGAKIIDIEIRDGVTNEGGWETHETAFLNIRTSKGVIDAVTHNEHNGYYGGFSFAAEVKEDDAG